MSEAGKWQSLELTRDLTPQLACHSEVCDKGGLHVHQIHILPSLTCATQHSPTPFRTTDFRLHQDSFSSPLKQADIPRNIVKLSSQEKSGQDSVGRM